jgi:hypothetical protein
MVADVQRLDEIRSGLTDPRSFLLPGSWAPALDYIWTGHGSGTSTEDPMVRRQVILKFEGDRPRWVHSVEERVNQLLALPRGWDGYGAPSPQLDMVVAAIRLLLEAMEDSTPAPNVFPTNQGGIQLEWHQGGIDLEIEISSVDQLDATLYDDADPDRETDLDLTVNHDSLRKVLMELTQRVLMPV